jgi:hypothetical protein
VLKVFSTMDRGRGKRKSLWTNSEENPAIQAPSSGEWSFSNEVSWIRFRTKFPTRQLVVDPPGKIYGAPARLNFRITSAKSADEFILCPEPKY